MPHTSKLCGLTCWADMLVRRVNRDSFISDSAARHTGRVDGIRRVSVNTTMADAAEEALQGGWWGNLSSKWHYDRRLVDCQTIVWTSSDRIWRAAAEDEFVALPMAAGLSRPARQQLAGSCSRLLAKLAPTKWAARSLRRTHTSSKPLGKLRRGVSAFISFFLASTSLQAKLVSQHANNK